jgi:hypothetical protein
MAKIAAADRDAMNQLYVEELNKTGAKVAGEDVQAFEDHKEFLDTLESVLKDDKKEGWAPNDPKLD